MKNLLIFIDPAKKFVQDYECLNSIQIDNSLSLGWKPEDIILVTNFPYEYRGIKAITVDDYETFDNHRSTKIPVINELFARDLIEDNQIYWFHDHDAFQLTPLGEIDLEGKDAGFTSHGYQSLWNAGSFFFKPSSREIFQSIWYFMNLRNSSEQYALTYMWENNLDNINSRYKLLNQTYNIGIYHTDAIIAMSEKPIKVAHFHPHKKHHLEIFRSRGLLPDNLLTIFAQYGIK